MSSSAASSSASAQTVSSRLSRMTIHDDMVQPPVALLLERTERQYQELQKREDEIIARFCQTTNSAEEGQLAEIKLQTLGQVWTQLAREKNTVNDTLQKLRQQLALQAQSQCKLMFSVSLVKCQNALKNVTCEQEKYQPICKFVNNCIKHAGHCGLKAIAVKNSTQET